MKAIIDPCKGGPCDKLVSDILKCANPFSPSPYSPYGDQWLLAIAGGSLARFSFSVRDDGAIIVSSQAPVIPCYVASIPDDNNALYGVRDSLGRMHYAPSGTNWVIGPTFPENAISWLNGLGIGTFISYMSGDNMNLVAQGAGNIKPVSVVFRHSTQSSGNIISISRFVVGDCASVLPKPPPTTEFFIYMGIDGAVPDNQAYYMLGKVWFDDDPNNPVTINSTPDIVNGSFSLNPAAVSDLAAFGITAQVIHDNSTQDAIILRLTSPRKIIRINGGIKLYRQTGITQVETFHTGKPSGFYSQGVVTKFYAPPLNTSTVLTLGTTNFAWNEQELIDPDGHLHGNFVYLSTQLGYGTPALRNTVTEYGLTFVDYTAAPTPLTTNIGTYT